MYTKNVRGKKKEPSDKVNSMKRACRPVDLRASIFLQSFSIDWIDNFSEPMDRLDLGSQLAPHFNACFVNWWQVNDRIERLLDLISSSSTELTRIAFILSSKFRVVASNESIFKFIQCKEPCIRHVAMVTHEITNEDQKSWQRPTRFPWLIFLPSSFFKEIKSKQVSIKHILRSEHGPPAICRNRNRKSTSIESLIWKWERSASAAPMQLQCSSSPVKWDQIVFDSGRITGFGRICWFSSI